MTKDPPDERLVYLALTNTFKATEAQVRKTKKVRELIVKKQHNVNVRNLIREHNLDNVCNMAKALLEH
jgi:lipoate synthase